MVKPLANSILVPLGFTAAASAADAGILKKNRRIKVIVILPPLSASHNHPSSTILIISNDEMEDIIKIVKSLEDSGLLLKGVTETIQNEVKEQKGGFLSILLSTLGESLLKNILTGWEINIAEEGVVRAGYGNKKGRKSNKMDF